MKKQDNNPSPEPRVFGVRTTKQEERPQGEVVIDTSVNKGEINNDKKSKL